LNRAAKDHGERAFYDEFQRVFDFREWAAHVSVERFDGRIVRVVRRVPD
jgi:hypothetical protein